MTLNSLILILLSVALGTGAQTLLKYAMTSSTVQAALLKPDLGARLLGVFFNPFVILGLALYAAGAVVWLFVLAKTPLSTAFPFTALAIVISILAGATIFHEQIDIFKIVAIILIATGILVLSVSQLKFSV